MEIKTNLANIILEAKSNEDKILDIIKIMNPLIKTYVNKLFFLEKEDAEQEILEAIIIAIHEIHECNNSGQAFVYLQNAIKFRYYALCKSNITMQLTEEKF